MKLQKIISANINLIALALLIFIAMAFNFSPIVQTAHIIAPETIYTAATTSECDLIREAKPWYAKFNYWYWLWLIGVPLIIFFFTPNDKAWKRSAGTFAALLLCYITMNLSFMLSEQLEYGLFLVHENIAYQQTWDMRKCAPYARIGAKMFFPFVSVAYSCFYISLCLGVWRGYHHFKKNIIFTKFKYDLFSKIVSILAVVIPILFALFVIFITIRNHY